jgi:type VI secretion system protein VasG
LSLNVAALVKKLNKTCLDSLQSSAGLCVSKTNYSVEIEHWLLKLLEAPGNDLARLIVHFQIDANRLKRDLYGYVDRLKTGNQRTPTLSPSLERLLKESWLIASIHFQASFVRSGHVLMAVLSDDGLGRQTRASSTEFAKVTVETLFDTLPTIVVGSSEDEPRASEPGPTPVGGQRYYLDLSAKIVEEPDNPLVLGREPDVRRVFEIMNCRLKNVPVLIGESGVGCEMVVEALARVIAAGDAPVDLDGHAVLTLDARSLVAEEDSSEALAGALDALAGRKARTILYIESLDLVAGGGKIDGAARRAALLKAALARGLVRFIGSAADSEYRRILKSDTSFDRWFQPIHVKELSVDATIRILRALKVSFEQHHKVGISDGAIVAAATLSAHYLTGQFLPQKAVALFDEVTSRKSLEKRTENDQITALRRRLRRLQQAEPGTLDQDSHMVEELRGEIKSREDELRERLLPLDVEVDASDVVKVVSEKTGLPEHNILDAVAEPLAPDGALRPSGPAQSSRPTRGTKVFISHSTRDREFVEREIIGLLHEHGIESWYSRDDIRPTDTWERTILRGLKSCDWFLLVMSGQSAQSEWVKDEVNWAIVERPDRIIPVLIEDCESSDFHIRMSRIQHVDLREPTPQARRLLLALLEEPIE